MWPFCGGENFTLNNRFKHGYKKSNKNTFGFDFNKWMWNRKKKNWQNNINIIAPTKWMALCVQQSKLMKKFNVKVIPYPIDTKFWCPLDKKNSKSNFQLDINKKYLMLMISYAEFSWKGGDLFLQSLDYLTKDIRDILEIILLGNPSPKFKKMLINKKIKVNDFSYVIDHNELKKLYNASDLIVIPSRVDNLPLKALEASACGLPIVSFNIGGMKDLVIHNKNGWLAKPFYAKDLARGIKKILNNKNVHREMSAFSRKYVIKKFRIKTIVSQYVNFYKEILCLKNN